MGLVESQCGRIARRSLSLQEEWLSTSPNESEQTVQGQHCHRSSVRLEKVGP